jgi:hypothetical protein
MIYMYNKKLRRRPINKIPTKILKKKKRRSCFWLTEAANMYISSNNRKTKTTTTELKAQSSLNDLTGTPIISHCS